MGKLTINIVNDDIQLISSLQEKANADMSWFSFDIKTLAGSNIDVVLTRVNGTVEDYDIAEIDIYNGFGWQTIPANSINVTLVNGDAKVRITISSFTSNPSGCNQVNVLVRDNTNVTEDSVMLSKCT